MTGINLLWISLILGFLISVLTVVWVLDDQKKQRVIYERELKRFQAEEAARRKAEAEEAARKEAERQARIAAGLPPEPEEEELDKDGEDNTDTDIENPASVVTEEVQSDCGGSRERRPLLLESRHLPAPGFGRYSDRQSAMESA